jgi:hypothetical protein
MTDYITSTALKSTLELTGETYADADISAAITAASRVIDAYKNTRFYPTTETRYYTGDPCELRVRIDDLSTSTGATVSIDVDGDGVYETTWTSGTDYYLDPANADLQGLPFNAVTIRRQSGRRWPYYQRSVKVVGAFGWATAPAQVTEACTILAGRYLRRARETPYGIVAIATDSVGLARLGRIDPDVAFMLDNITGETPRLIA